MKKTFADFLTQEMSKKEKSKRYIFHLVGINLEKIDQKYGIGVGKNSYEEVDIPDKTTKIEDLQSTYQTPDVISFLDESKTLRRCHVSMIDHRTGTELRNDRSYRCAWDRDLIPSNVCPIGCPIRYVPNRVTKTYYSEITKDTYTISEDATDLRVNELTKRKDDRLSVAKRGFYETDKVFCSFNCCRAFIQHEEQKRNPLYVNSESLLLQMYLDFEKEYRKQNDDNNTPLITKVSQIIPAHDWQRIKENGGSWSIEKFRNSFNSIESKYIGVIKIVPMGRLYEDKICF